MKCNRCKHDDTKVIESRDVADGRLSAAAAPVLPATIGSLHMRGLNAPVSCHQERRDKRTV